MPPAGRAALSDRISCRASPPPICGGYSGEAGTQAATAEGRSQRPTFPPADAARNDRVEL